MTSNYFNQLQSYSSYHSLSSLPFQANAFIFCICSSVSAISSIFLFLHRRGTDKPSLSSYFHVHPDQVLHSFPFQFLIYFLSVYTLLYAKAQEPHSTTTLPLSNILFSRKFSCCEFKLVHFWIQNQDSSKQSHKILQTITLLHTKTSQYVIITFFNLHLV